MPASMAGLTSSARLGAYTAAKFAVVGMSEVLRAEMAPHGVGVTVFCPGLIRTRLDKTTRALGGDGIAGASMEEGMDPLEAVQHAWRAVRGNRPYAITHPKYWPVVARRFQLLEEAFAPATGGAVG
jgi:short-subunit dehydrogenase